MPDTEHSPAREQAHAHRAPRGRRQPATCPGEIPGQTSIFDALDERQDQEEPDGQA